jgi:hypothetical protein
MPRLMAGFLVAAAMSTGVMLAAGPAWSADNAQQQKMTTCNAEAKTKALSGDARKTFMSQCLSGSATPAATDKTASCTSDADSKKLHGAARTSFIKKCTS